MAITFDPTVVLPLNFLQEFSEVVFLGLSM
jgi:hypothetical protein